MARLDRSGFSDFDRLTTLVRHTHELLDWVLERGRLGPDAKEYLAGETLPHLEVARLGFRAGLRADSASTPELRYLVRQGAVIDEPSTAAERAAAARESAIEARLRRHPPSVRLRPEETRALTALAHARLVLGMLPRLPDGDVRFRAGRRTYADIPVPRGPAELAGRLEELEREVWRMAAGREPEPLDPAFRRTYGFFDVADQLARRGFPLH